MVTKKRKATAKVAEAAPTYTARSRQVTTKQKKVAPAGKSRARIKKASPGEALWEMLQSLPEEEQSAFVKQMLKNPEWREDIMDICVVMARKGEPKRPFEEFIAELERERRK